MIQPRRTCLPWPATGLRLLLVAAVVSVSLAGCSRQRYATSSQRTAAGVSATAACAPLPTVTPPDAGIAASVIDSVQRAAEAMKSDALLILRDGKIVHEWTYRGFTMPFNPQSVTKAVTGLGVGVLLDGGQIPSLDLPLSDVFPEFNAPDKRAVTLRMLMNHTSGVAAARGEAQFYTREAADVGAFVRTRPMSETPGTVARYSNVGAQLVSHVVQARAAKPLHAVLDSALFTPLCIRDWQWHTDERGATYGYSRFLVTARDLAKIGQLVLDTGQWRGVPVLRAATIDTLTMIRGGTVDHLMPTPYVGLWQHFGGDSVRIDTTLRSRLRTAAVSDSLQMVLRRLAGSSADTVIGTATLLAALDSTFGRANGVSRWDRETRGAVPLRRWRSPARAVGHSGSWGQWLLIFPETRTVVVRYASWTHPGRKSEDDGYGWNSIVSDLYRLVGRRATTDGGPRD